MSRPSRESLLTKSIVDVAQIRLVPRSQLPPKVRRVFAELVASVGPAHFREPDRLVLEELARAVAVSRELQAALDDQGVIVGGELNPLVQALGVQQRLIVSLATKCRLTVLSRISKDKAGSTSTEGRVTGLDAAFALVANRG